MSNETANDNDATGDSSLPTVAGSATTWKECELDKGRDSVFWREHISGLYVEVQDMEGTSIGTLPKGSSSGHVFAMMRGFYIGYECGEAHGQYLKALEIQRALNL